MNAKIIVLFSILFSFNSFSLTIEASSTNIFSGSKTNSNTNIIVQCNLLNDLYKLHRKIALIENKKWGIDFRQSKLSSYIADNCSYDIKKINSYLSKYDLEVNTTNINDVVQTFYRFVLLSITNYGMEDLLNLKLVIFYKDRPSKEIGRIWCFNKTPLILTIKVNHKQYYIEEVGVKEHMERTMESQDLIAYGLIYTEGQTWTYTDTKNTSTFFTAHPFYTTQAKIQIVMHNK